MEIIIEKYNNFRNKCGISSFTLKVIAILAMLTDHIGRIFQLEYPVFNIIGRISFPIFAFLLVIGASHTFDIKKYKLRILIFALISEIPFDMALYGEIFHFSSQNVMFTLFIGLYMIEELEKNSSIYIKAVIIIIALLWSDFMYCDYGEYGIMLILVFYYLREYFLADIAGTCIVELASPFNNQVFAILALIPIYLYNEKQGIKMKWIAYVIYPFHFIILFLIKRIIVYST
ncbi:TraX protein [Acetitomaculum ruminis DSM 5522]|uniref:TraX protein n=1 Tax=Acetitomaculum ruminis DSM 5522 TaxID=1120918 RepID=A0A1I0VLS2_9FIRM|nr:TraX family protein [Acetitomaculum ruminis]SFA77241.1 TraX protein [Acetitomaculum ruminis DSM 5522]